MVSAGAEKEMLMPTTLFSDLKPTRVLHVSVGTGTGDGSANNPFHSIQAAVNAATPGTAILVHAGTYTENVKIPNNRGGSSSAPVWLVSADGAQKATIIAPDATKPVIQALGVDNYVIRDLKLSGGYDGIQFSQSGRDFTNLVNNVVLQNNVITNVAHDGIKVGQADNVYVLDNRIDKVGAEEGIDFVAVTNAVIARNEISNVGGTSAAIFAKGGSTNIRIEDNFIHDVSGDGISAGGNTDATSFKPGYTGYEAKNVDVIGNRVENVGKRPVSVRGAFDVDVAGNLLEAGTKYATAVYVTTGSQNSTHPVFTKDVRISGNTVAAAKIVVQIDAGNGAGVVESGTKSGSWSDSVGPSTLTAFSWLGASGSLGTSTSGSTVGTTDKTPVPSPAPSPAPAPAPAPSAPVASPVPQPSEPVKMPVVSGSGARESATPVTNIVGTTGQDQLVGTNAADRIDGLNREDVMSGGRGDDTYVASGYKDVVVERAGEGTDTVELNDNRYFLSNNVENLVAKSAISSTLVGNDLDNQISGNVGNDILVGHGGNDVLRGGGGADTFVIERGGGASTILDFEKQDKVAVSGGEFATFAALKAAFTQVGADAVLNLGDGQTLTLKNVSVSSLTPEQFAYDNLSQLVRGSASPTTIVGGGTKQSDLLGGTDGHDLLDGAGGGDVLVGGNGDDTYVVRHAHDVIIEKSGGGTDSVKLYASDYALALGVENGLIASASGARLEGNASANKLVGGDGNDTLIGGGGKDLLTGGKGADIFMIEKAGQGSDTISDFTKGQDKLDLSGLLDHDPSGKLSFEAGTGGMQVFFDHGGQHELVALLTGISSMGASDYII